MIFFLDFDRTLFDTEKFYNALERALIVPEDVLSISDIKNFLYADSLPFLDERKVAGDSLILASRGTIIIQKTKAEQSGILAYLSDALYVEPGTSKGSAIQAYLAEHPVVEGEKAFFLDDTITELEEVQKQCPSVQSVRMRRASARNAGQEAPHLTEVKNFSELKALLLY